MLYERCVFVFVKCKIVCGGEEKGGEKVKVAKPGERGSSSQSHKQALVKY